MEVVITASGDIGFNEPGSSLALRTRIQTLTDRSRNDMPAVDHHRETYRHRPS